MLPERPLSYRAQDDEDHRLAMCGLSFDARAGEELEDFKQRHFDFTIFASGLPRPTPHDAKQGPRGVGRSAIPASGVATSLGPAPLSTT